MNEKINIKDISGGIRYTTPLNEGCVWRKELMKHDQVVIKFSDVGFIGFRKGDYIEMSFGKYEMVDNVFPTFNKTTGGYDYELTFEALHYKWKNKILFFNRGNKGNNKNKEAKWSLTDMPDKHLSIILENLAALGYNYNGSPYKFSFDSSIDHTAKTISYDGINILDGLNKIAETWEAEWWIQDDCIWLGKCQDNDDRNLINFVMNDNVSDMSRSSASNDFANRLYAFGSTRNLPPDYRSSAENLYVNGIVQKRLMLPGKDCIDAPSKGGITDAEIVERVVIFDDVYPRVIGTMTTVTTKEYMDEIQHEDGTSTFKPWNAYRFTDEEMVFSKDYIIPGQELRMVFTSGNLNGMDFGVIFNPQDEPVKPEEDEEDENIEDPEDQEDPEGRGENQESENNEDNEEDKDTQVFEIVRNEDYGIPLPNDILKPEPQDNYILYGFDASLIDGSSISNAEAELEGRAKKYLEKCKEDPSVYDCIMNMTSEDSYPDLDVGDPIRLLNPVYFDGDGRKSRIYGFEKQLDNSQVTYTVGGTTKYSRLAKVENEIKEIVYDGNAYSGGGGSGVYVIGRYDTAAPSNRNVFSALRSKYEFVSRLLNDVVHGAITFMKGIFFGKFVEGSTGAGIYQDEHGNWHIEGDYGHFRKKLTAEEIEIQKTYHIGGKQISTVAAMVCSRVEECDGYWRCYFLAEDPNGNRIDQQWRVDDLAYVETFNLIKQGDGMAGNHFLWRRVINVSDENNIKEEEQEKEQDQEQEQKEHYIDITKENGDINSAAYSDAPMEGDHIIQLGHVSDPERQSAIIQASAGDGSPYFRIYKGIKPFKLPTPKIDLNPKESKITAGSIILESTGKEITDVLDDMVTDMDAVKKQADNMWVLWFGEDIPTLDNFPASDWDTDKDREQHLQDIVVIDNPEDDTNNGRAWRFHQSEEGEFHWAEITDKYLIDALGIAVEGRDSAKQKRRNFVNQPTTDDEYEVGDTWSNATYENADGTLLYDDDNLVAISDKAKGALFNIAHWRPTSKVTTSYIKVLEKSIQLVVTDAADAQDAADKAIEDALEAANEAKRANESIGKTNGEIVEVKRSVATLKTDIDGITAVVEGVTFNGDGKITNISLSGLGIEDEFAVLFSRRVDKDEIATQADISAFITKDEDGNYISNAAINADKIRFNGMSFLGSAIFDGNYMFSQNGINESGMPDDNYQDFGTDGFIPNILLDFKTGKGHLAGRNISWGTNDVKIEADEIRFKGRSFLGSAIFDGNYMFSQTGVDANGNQTSNYEKFGTSDFIPNILFDFKTGKGHLGSGKISWDTNDAKIQAEHINFIGKTMINGNFIVDENGDLILNNITAKNGTFEGVLSGTMKNISSVNKSFSISEDGFATLSGGSRIGPITITNNGNLTGVRTIFYPTSSMYSFSPIGIGQNEDSYLSYIRDGWSKTSFFNLVVQTPSRKLFNMELPDMTDYETIMGITSSSFELTFFVPHKWSFGSLEQANDNRYIIKCCGQSKIIDNDGGEMSQIELAKGDVVKLIGYPVLGWFGSTTQSQLNYYISSWRK